MYKYTSELRADELGTKAEPEPIDSAEKAKLSIKTVSSLLI
jgi:hypothetical protein